MENTVDRRSRRITARNSASTGSFGHGQHLTARSSTSRWWSSPRVRVPAERSVAVAREPAGHPGDASPISSASATDRHSPVNPSQDIGGPPPTEIMRRRIRYSARSLTEDGRALAEIAPTRAIAKERLVYVRHGDGREELFDREADPDGGNRPLSIGHVAAGLGPISRGSEEN